MTESYQGFARSRRLRATEQLRGLVRETRVSPKSLVYPLFVREGSNIVEPLPSMADQTRYSPDSVAKGVEAALQAGVSSFLLFGLPEQKDAQGSGAFAADGVVQQALIQIKKSFGDEVVLITDVCLCEYTDHGHCGLIVEGGVDNDSTLPLLARTAVSHVEAGADIVAPSGMMDGTVGTLRAALDQAGFAHTPIMSYAAKQASAFYGPFRDAAGSAPQFGDRKAYQMDFHNAREAQRRIASDVEEGADIVIVKPALPCLDIIRSAADWLELPIAAYAVSGEYAMVKAAAAAGLIDEQKVVLESAVAVFRAGAGILITYHAEQLALAMARGEIG